MFNRVYPLVLLLGSICFSSAGLADSIYNFDGDIAGTTTPFTNLSAQVLTTFSSSVPNAFVIQSVGTPNPFTTLKGNILAENTAAGVTNQSLTVTLDDRLNNLAFSGIVFNFAVYSPTPTPLNLSVYFNGTLVGTATATERVPTGSNLPEGVMQFYIPYTYGSSAPTIFNSFVISTSAPGFAVDNIDLMPEPGSFFLVGLALSGTVLVVLLCRKVRLQQE